MNQEPRTTNQELRTSQQRVFRANYEPITDEPNKKAIQPDGFFVFSVAQTRGEDWLIPTH